jgi:hypothetical protein
LWQKKLEQRQNPYCHIAEFLALKQRVELLDITDEALLKKTLVLSDAIIRDRTYLDIKDFSTITKRPPKKKVVFWRYDTEAGVSEFVPGFLSIIIDRFTNPETIQTALMEIMLYCIIRKERSLKPLIDYANSRNKAQFIRRIPFLFLSELRLLIADGVLVFDTDEKATHSLKHKISGLLLRVFGAILKR